MKSLGTPSYNRYWSAREIDQKLILQVYFERRQQLDRYLRRLTSSLVSQFPLASIFRWRLAASRHKSKNAGNCHNGNKQNIIVFLYKTRWHRHDDALHSLNIPLSPAAFHRNSRTMTISKISPPTTPAMGATNGEEDADGDTRERRERKRCYNPDKTSVSLIMLTTEIISHSLYPVYSLTTLSAGEGYLRYWILRSLRLSLKQSLSSSSLDL